MTVLCSLLYKRFTQLVNYCHKQTYQTYLSLVLILSMGAFFTFYFLPDGSFWDENYHICSAMKYINGTMYMEPHPPLGKLVIALGEYILPINKKIDNNQFLETNHLKKFPKKFSFKGVRFFPVWLTIFSALLFFTILHRLSPHPLLAFVFSLFYIFDNAYVLHTRAAMLESTQIFFIFLVILFFLKAIQSLSSPSSPSPPDNSISSQNHLRHPTLSLKHYFFVSAFIGLACATKVNSAITVLFLVFLFCFEQRHLFISLIKRFRIFNLILLIKEGLIKTSLSILVISAVFCAVFYIHFSLGKKIVKERYYGASDEYKKIIKSGKTSALSSFPVMLRDNLKYISDYQKKVPALNKKKKNENGSHPLEWMLATKPIRYRWNYKEEGGRYLYLQPNPVVWGVSLFTLIFSVGLILLKILSKLAFKTPIGNKKHFTYILLFLTLHVCYMVAILQIKRVMYLYHYFIPLFFSLLLAYSLLHYLFEKQIKEKNVVFFFGIGIFVLEIFLTFLYFAPLTYYMYLDSNDFLQRQWLPQWHFKP